MMAAAGWPWGPIILAHLGLAIPPAAPPDGRQAAIWHRLPEYTDFTASPPPGTAPVMADAARRRLANMLGTGAEPRQSQSDYAAALAAGFDTPEAGPTPAMVLAEAGTGDIVGRDECRAGLDFDLYPHAAAPDRGRTDPPLSRSRRLVTQGGDPQGTGELSVSSQSGGGAWPACRGTATRHRAGAYGTLGRGDE